MVQNVASLKLFTLTACPMGKSMGMVMNEVQAKHPSLPIDTIYVEISTDEANAFRIKKNPTTLFLNDGDVELDRIEGFAETEIILNRIEQLNEGIIMNAERLAENVETTEHYTVYMLNDKEELTPVQQAFLNKTSIAAPRIHAILSLLAAKDEKHTNVFPTEAKLTSVSFSDHKGIIDIAYPTLPKRDDLELRREALQLTLEHYGITRIELIESIIH